MRVATTVPPMVQTPGTTAVVSEAPVQASADQWQPGMAPGGAPNGSVAQRLSATWATSLFAPVRDGELPAAVDALIDYHLQVGFYGDRLDGMQRLHGFGPGGEIEVSVAPNRKKAPVARDADGHGNCGLCKPPFETERGLSWRGWRLWPNAFPYVPTADQHILLTSATHQAQGYSPSVLGDMLEFQGAAAGGRQLTMHFNGIAGNSQFHLHWQATRVTLPIQRALDEGRLPTRDVLRARDGSVASYDHGPYAGLLVSGDRDFLVRWATRIIDRLNADPQTRGAYNLLLLQPRAGRMRLAIIPRRADNLKPVVGSFGKSGVGAFNVGGFVTIPRDEVPDDFSDAIGPALRATVVPPSELPWLADLARLPNAELPGPLRTAAAIRRQTEPTASQAQPLPAA